MRLLLSVTLCLSIGAAGAPGARAAEPTVASADLAVLTAAGSPFADGDRIVCLGDSITQGGNGPTGYVGLLRAAFAAAGHPAVEVLNAGVGGNKVPDLLKRYERDVLAAKPTAVFIYIGINDVWHHGGDLGAPKQRFEAGLREIIARIRAAGAVVVLATPTVIGEKPDGGNPLDKSLDVFAQSGHAIADELGAEWCDLRSVFAAALKRLNPDGKDRGVLTVDTVHLNDAGNALVAREAARSLVAAMAHHGLDPSIQGAGGFVGQALVTIGLNARAQAAGAVARYTVDGGEPTAASPVFAKPLELRRATVVKARVFAAGKPVGTTVTAECAPLELRPAATVGETRPGLGCAYYEGSVPGIPDFAKLTPTRTLVTALPNLDFPHRVDDYALRFTGFLDVPQDGLYRFVLTSDDGSRLTIDDQVVIDNDGFHDMVPTEGRAALRAGKHAVTVAYFQGGGGHGLELRWNGPGIAPAIIPPSAFSTAASAP
jgi:lysophospholipase L1-like esterase